MAAVPERDSQLPFRDASFGGLGREPTAGEAEQWARKHPGDPQVPRALVHAGWRLSREGEHERALGLFREAAGTGGSPGWHARIAIVDQLCALGREEEAEAAQQELRGELDALSSAELWVYHEMTEVLADRARIESALQWCEAGLGRAPAAGEAEEEAAAGDRHGPAVSRSFLRAELGIAPDAQDLAAAAQANSSLEELGSLLVDLQEELAGPRGALDLPEDDEAFDSVVLCWSREDFDAVRSRWPKTTLDYGPDYTTYATRIQYTARSYSECGAAHVWLVTGRLADYEAYADAAGADPADPKTRQEFGTWRAGSDPAGRCCGRLRVTVPAGATRVASTRSAAALQRGTEHRV